MDDNLLTRAAMMKKIADLEAEVERLTSKTYCLYCGEEFPIDTGGADVTAHIRTCPKHPMRNLEAEVERQRELIRWLKEQTERAMEMLK